MRDGAFSGGWTVRLRMAKMEMNCSKETRIIEASLGFLGKVAFLWPTNYWLAIDILNGAVQCKWELRLVALSSTMSLAFSSLSLIFSLRLQFRFPHHQAAMIVALRQAVDYLLVRAATTPSTIAEPTHADERILNVIKSLSRANAGSFGVSRGGGNQFQPRGRPLPGWVQLLASFSLVLHHFCTTYVREATMTWKWSSVLYA